MRLTWRLALAFVTWLGVSTPVARAQTAGCQFVLGFQALHDLDPADIGDCTENQGFAANGDAQQHTNKGLMAWRKADNWTAFTNGYMTWINGPTGLVARLNTQRFTWEQDPTTMIVGVWGCDQEVAKIAPDGSGELVGFPDKWLAFLKARTGADPASLGLKAIRFQLVANPSVTNEPNDNPRINGHGGGKTYTFPARVTGTAGNPSSTVISSLRLVGVGAAITRLYVDADAGRTYGDAGMNMLAGDVSRANLPACQGLA
jgi:hypothetical protein